MGWASRLYTFLAQQTIRSAEVNEELNQILALLNGGIENNNVKPGAGIRQDEGKLVLDYDEIRTRLYTDLSNWLDGSALLDGSVPLGKMEYTDNALVAAGIYTNTNPGSFPWTVPGGTFEQYMLVIWGATMNTTDSASGAEKQLALKVDGNTLSAAHLGVLKQEVQSEQGSSGTRTQSTNMCCVFIDVSNANNYTANPPTIDRSQSHTFDITEITSYSANVIQKNMLILGR